MHYLFYDLIYHEPWSVSNSKLDWNEVGQFASGVFWQIGGGRLLVAVVGLSVMFLFAVKACGGCLMAGRFDSSLTLLPLSSLTCSKEGSISFASSCF